MQYVIRPPFIFMAFLALSAALSAQNGGTAPAGNQRSDLTGIWNRKPVRLSGGAVADEANGIPFFGFTKEEPSFQAAALETYKANRKGLTSLRLKGIDELDPSASCFPPGPTRFYTDPRPFEIRQTADIVYILPEDDHWVRRVYIGEKEPPDGYPMTWMGYSVGRYEGDTLVVETTGINAPSWLDALGHPHSEDLHLTERYRRVNHNTLEIDFTFNDPATYTKPWSGKKIFQLQPASFEIREEVVCEKDRRMGLRTGAEFLEHLPK